MPFLSKQVIGRFYVSFPGCKSSDVTSYLRFYFFKLILPRGKNISMKTESPLLQWVFLVVFSSGSHMF